MRLFILFQEGMDPYVIENERPLGWRLFYYAMADSILLEREAEYYRMSKRKPPPQNLAAEEEIQVSGEIHVISSFEDGRVIESSNEGAA